MSEIKWDATDRERSIIRKVVDRAVVMAKEAKLRYKQQDIMMDIEACHCNGTPLNLKRLLGFDDFNFAHDIFGIRRHLDRETGKISRFLPRCTRKSRRRAVRA